MVSGEEKETTCNHMVGLSRVQTTELHHDQEQADHERQTDAQKILQVVSEAHTPQGEVMKKLEDKIRSRFENCSGVVSVKFRTTLIVDIKLKSNNFEYHDDLLTTQEQLRNKFPGVSLAFNYVVQKKGEGK